MNDDDAFDKLFYDLTMNQCPFCGQPRSKHVGDECPTGLEEDEEEDWIEPREPWGPAPWQ